MAVFNPRKDLTDYILQRQYNDLEENIAPDTSISAIREKADSLLDKDELNDVRNRNFAQVEMQPNVMQKIGAVAGGLAGLYNSFNDLAQIEDTTQQWNNINSLQNVGMNNYGSFEEVNQDYNRMAGLDTSYDYKDIRGGSDGQRAMGVGSAMLQGASAGAAFGPWGAAAGATIGLGAGLLGIATGNSKARLEKLRLENGARMAATDARDNLSAANENLSEYNFRSGVSRRADMGGQIRRRHESALRYADNIIHHKARYASEGGSHALGNVKRIKCKGGTLIRINK